MDKDNSFLHKRIYFQPTNSMFHIGIIKAAPLRYRMIYDHLGAFPKLPQLLVNIVVTIPWRFLKTWSYILSTRFSS